MVVKGSRTRTQGRRKQSKQNQFKLQYFCAIELWDRGTHVHMLIDTAAAVDEDEYVGYISVVRRRLELRDRHSDTVAEIESKALETIIQTATGSCKAIFLAKDISAFDPNMFLNEIETAHA